MGITTKSLAAAAVFAALTLAGCGTEGHTQKVADRSSSTRVGPSGEVDAAFLERLQDRALPAVRSGSLAQAIAAEPVVLTGVIDGVEAGPTTVQAISTELDTRAHTVVVRVRVERAFKSDGVKLAAGFAYVTIRSGSEMTDHDGAAIGDVPSKNPTVADIAKAMPAGTRVVLATRPTPPPRAGAEYGRVVDQDAGHPAGAALLEGDLPPFFSIEDGDGRLTGWPSMTYDDAVAALEKAFP
ncbi:hypothetical protein GCM10022237_47680 [Nocardioides ginsengisoli]|uniref:Lipoprotein n=1 Tax=Nocardioides ginsengisoli TaxID=363868 RepID=A0ABW3W3W7_9ACTN